MSWSKFTKEYIKLFMNKFNINESSPLLVSIQNEQILINKFIESYKFNIRVKKNKLDIIKKKYVKYADTNWVDQNVLLYYDTLTIIFDISWDNNHIYIKTKKNIIKIITRIKILIGIIEYLKLKNKDIKKINIFIVLSKLEKIFPINNIMNVENTNTGYTDLNENIIFIWRSEEFEKVLFHELIHYFNMDCKHQHISNIINVSNNNTHSYLEAITDFWGIYYHLIYLSIITNINIKLLLETEISFVKNQAMQLIKLYKIKKLSDIYNKEIKQNTPAFSYYILKYLLFEYFINNNFDELNDYNKLIKKSINNFKIDNYIKIKSSRMSLLQLKY